MLEQLMTHIRSGGTLQPSLLAQQLGTSPQMVEAMLEHLERVGYIRPYQSSCGDACAGCSLKAQCNLPTRPNNNLKIWQG